MWFTSNDGQHVQDYDHQFVVLYRQIRDSIGLTFSSILLIYYQGIIYRKRK
ncbi:hypothetical protein OKW21_000386 [Catalinimonas alkaloidigena]|uniref:hypothetical protein n=1 Tax=Catalinimonas alkaloidigena TaxID=1075417 RepID=UPI0024066CA2|nr:hypothetical protein [Catalinimonas alkaloidigena]MDF9795123.1 hypothetical protein [Catalinimonas alkaloidigena]